MKGKLFILFSGIWTVCIFQKSLQSSYNSSGINDYILLLSQLLMIEVESASLIFSIIAHIFEYFFLAIFLSFGLRNLKCNYPSWVVLFIALLIAVLDEFIQGFVVGRASSVIDVLIDFGGAICGLCFQILILKFQPKHYLPD